MSMRLLILILALLLPVSATAAGEFRYSIGGGGGQVNLKGSDFYSFDWETGYNFTVSHRLTGRWLISLDYSFFTLSNDTSVDSTSSIGDISNNSPLDFEATRLGVMAGRMLFAPESRFNVTAGLGGGVLFWKMIDVENGTTFKVRDDRGSMTDFSSSELFFSGSLGLVFSPARRLSINVDAHADYLTHAGAEFAPDVKSSLNRWLLGAGVTLNFRLGSKVEKGGTVWVSDSTWAAQSTRQLARRISGLDSDGDGVADEDDGCLNTPPGVSVDKQGCARDSDFDGVPDGLDDCPGTGRAAIGQVDIYGCPVDSDFDGIPDYLDACPFNQVGATVTDNGCPVDSDKDGVPDGLDDCPGTLYGVDVDKYGCIDLSMFARPMVLNINYPPGSFEIDPNSKERLQRLAGILNFVPAIKLELHGYTDNIGTTIANRSLSEKRANRVRDYLVTQGIDAGRIKVFGRGEENFVASNDTAEGRAKNRRIEIIFYR